MATEVAVFKLKDGRYPDDSTTPAGQVLKDTFDVLVEQPGFQRLYFGREDENPDTFRLFVDWDSVQSHKDFIATGDKVYNPFLEKFGQIVNLATATIFHTHFTPHPASEALSDHVSLSTEILVVHFPKDYSSADQDKFVEDFKKLVSVLEQHAKTHIASAGGWVEEDVDIPNSLEKGKAYISVLGWKSAADHMTFREDQHFKDNVHYLRDAKDLKGISMVHASLTQIDSGPVGDFGNSARVDAQEEVLNPQAGGEKNPPKTRSDGTTTKNTSEDHPYTTNSIKKERQGR